MAYPLKVMLSSRCNDDVPFTDGTIKLTALRKELKKKIEAEEIFGETAFEVWINDGDAAAAPADETAWEHCMSQVEDAEILICLYNGNAGWAVEAGDIGICHAELQQALQSGRTKVRLISLPKPVGKLKDAEKDRNERFESFINKESLFYGSPVNTKTDAQERVLQSIYECILDLVRRGKAHARKDKFDRGEALEWNRLDFARRKEAIEDVLFSNLEKRQDSERFEEVVAIEIEGRAVLLKPSAIPGPLTTAAARELVGRPHLYDHKTYKAHSKRKDVLGPVHLIACHRGITEGQASALLGFPDVITVKSGFGVYAVDDIQKSQLVFLENCRDSSSTRHMIQLFFDWLNSSGEAAKMVERANCRWNISKTISGAS